MRVEELRASLAELADTPEAATFDGRTQVRRIATQRRRRRRVVTLTCAVVVLGVVAVGFAALTSTGTSKPHVIIPAQTSPRELLRPVLADCPPTQVSEQTLTAYGPAGSSNEVFASPNAGLTGPIAVFHTEPAIDASTPGVPPLDPNMTIAATPAHYTQDPNTGISSLTWYQQSNVLAFIVASDLPQSDMELLAETLITHRGSLPASLTSLGSVGTRTVSRATCFTPDGTIRTLEAIHGSTASRYAEAFGSGANAWDEGDTTLIASAIGPPGSAPVSPQSRPAVRETTPDEWAALQQPPTGSTTPTDTSSTAR
jgi:hypothetical protein